MHENWWGLKESPFRSTGLERYHFAGRGQEEARARMFYTLRSGRGMMLLTGRTGHGVTHTLERFGHECDGRVVRAPAADAGEALESLIGALDAGGEGRPYDRVVRAVQAMASPVILWDDAHLAAAPALEVLRLLCDVPCAGETRLTAVLAGELALEEKVRGAAALSGRTEVQFRLGGLDEDELRPYVERRLEAAGWTRPVFAEAAYASIGFYAGGNPRRINALCEGALLLGFAEKAQLVTPEIIRRVAGEMERG